MSSSRYTRLGVSAGKEEVLRAAQVEGLGLFPGAFCKLVPDVLSGDPSACVALHSDGAGTKSAVAYLAFRERATCEPFGSLAQDALVMNIDDLVCVGATGPFVVSNTIGRNRRLVPGEAIEAIVQGYARCVDELGRLGVQVTLCGGETADVGDLVRTVVVDATAACRLERARVIDGSAIRPGDLIVGLGSSGQAAYESRPNSGIGSNGLTLARHVLLASAYRDRFPETCDPGLGEADAYRGPYVLSDAPAGLGMSVGEALLSPTRSYAPVVAPVLAAVRQAVHGIVHCTGGGQTKCLRLGAEVRYVKDSLLPVPPLFELIRSTGELEWEEMFQVFNMGHRMEIFVDPAAADEVIDVARGLAVPAQVVGRCEAPGPGPGLVIDGRWGTLAYG